MNWVIHIIIVSSVLATGHCDTVDADQAVAKVGRYYSQGCSGLVAELLGRSWKQAAAYRQGSAIGSNGNYYGVSPGTIVGFPGHVAVYVGRSGCRFVDVRGPSQNARCLNSYGSKTVYTYNY